jgi:hypothetical protein
VAADGVGVCDCVAAGGGGKRVECGGDADGDDDVYVVRDECVWADEIDGDNLRSLKRSCCVAFGANVTERKKKRVGEKVDAWASWGAAVLRPYIFGDGRTISAWVEEKRRRDAGATHYFVN